MTEEAPYSNRQIELLLDKQSADIKSYMDLKTDPILYQATKTNGRVNKLEETVNTQQSDINNLKKYLWGFGIIFGGVWAVVLATISGAASNFHF